MGYRYSGRQQGDSIFKIEIVGFYGPARLGGAELNTLKKNQLVRLWTPKAPATEPGRGPHVRYSAPAYVPRSRKRRKIPVADGDELASVPRKCIWYGT